MRVSTAALKYAQGFYREHSSWPSINELPFERFFLGGGPARRKQRPPPFSSSETTQYCIGTLTDIVLRVHCILHARSEDSPVLPARASVRQSLPNDLLGLCALLQQYLLHCGILEEGPASDVL